MSNELFDIVFRGDIVMGHNIVEVKQRLGQLFKIDTDKVNSLFTGRAVPLKRNIDAATAEKYQAIIIKAGAQVEVCSAGEVKPAVAKTPPRVRPAPVTDSKPKAALSLKERLALQAAQEQSAQEQAAKKQAAQKRAAPSVAASMSSNTGGSAGFELAPLGTLLSQPVECKQAAPVQVDVDGISLRPQQGDLLDASEKTPPVAAMVEAGDYDIADAGADLLKPSERVRVTPVEVDVSGYDIAEVGADLLDENHKLPLPEFEIDTSVFDLAPAGADLGQQKKDSPPPPPDTSALSLAD